MRKNVAEQVVGVQMVSAEDGSAFTGTVSVFVTGDGGTQAAGTENEGEAVHEGNGSYTYTPSQAETNFDHVMFTFTGDGAIPATVQVYPLPANLATVADRAGYLGKVWVDTVNGDDANAGTFDDRVKTLSAAKTIADAQGITEFDITGSVTINFAGAYKFTGTNWAGTLSGTVGASRFEIRGAALLVGSMTLGADSTIRIVESLIGCIINIPFSAGASRIDLLNCHVVSSTFNARHVVMTGCRSAATVTTTLNLNGANNSTATNLGDLRGDVTLRMSNNVRHYGAGRVTLHADSTGGTLFHSEDVQVTDNSGGAVTVTQVATVLRKADTLLETDPNDGDKSRITAAGLAAVLSVSGIDGKTLQQALQIIAATTAGSSSVNGNEITHLGLDGETARVVGTADSSGVRTEVTYP